MNLEISLAEKFGPPEFAFLPQVRNGTGYGRQVRTADALAMSLWPSRGIDLHGFELKESRSDWIREKKNPEKAEEIARFCDFWWLVVRDAALVKDGELPTSWGLLAPKGSSLAIFKPAARLKAKPVSKIFVAAVLRVASECSSINRTLEDSRKKGYEEGYSKGRENGRSEAKYQLQECERFKSSVAEFEASSGLKIGGWNTGAVGEAVREVMGLRGQNLEQRLAQTVRELEYAASACREAAKRTASVNFEICDFVI